MPFLVRIAIFGFLMFSGSLAHAQLDSSLPQWLRFDWTGRYPGASTSQTVCDKVTKTDRDASHKRPFYLAAWQKPKSNFKPDRWLFNPAKEIAATVSREFQSGSNSLKVVLAEMKRMGWTAVSTGKFVLDSIRIEREMDPYWQYYQDCDRWGAVFQGYHAMLIADREINEIAFRRSVYDRMVSDFQLNFARQFLRLSSRIADELVSGSWRLVSFAGRTFECLQYQEFLIVETPDYSWICTTVDLQQAPLSWGSFEQKCREYWVICQELAQPVWTELDCRTQAAWNHWRLQILDGHSNSASGKSPFRLVSDSKRPAHLSDSSQLKGRSGSAINREGGMRAGNPAEQKFDCELWEAFCE